MNSSRPLLATFAAMLLGSCSSPQAADDGFTDKFVYLPLAASESASLQRALCDCATLELEVHYFFISRD